MTIHTIGDDVKNSDIEYCINEYVRSIEYRGILYKHWFERKTMGELAEEYNMSETAIKRIVYDIGDKILLKAQKISS